MNDKKNSKTYQPIKTADGSPTLVPLGSSSERLISTKSTRGLSNKEEPMHSLQGAFSESLSIYGACLSKVMKLKKIRILSLGLGLGYNELIAHGFLLKENKSQFLLVSFEKEPKLIEFFKSWLEGKRFENSNQSNLKTQIKEFQNEEVIELNDPSAQIKLHECYDEILKRVSDCFGHKPEELRKFCYRSLKKEQFQIQGELPQKNPFHFGFTGILYDPFSSKSKPKLWLMNHLESFIESYCDPEKCIFSTYASTGDLKRALKSKGFHLTRRKGFSKKRESTLAVRPKETCMQEKTRFK